MLHSSSPPALCLCMCRLTSKHTVLVFHAAPLELTVSIPFVLQIDLILNSGDIKTGLDPMLNAHLLLDTLEW